MRTVKLTLAYDGTDFHGWQIQPDQPTIQRALTETLSRIANEPIAVHGAGRTDAGVHAAGQVAHFATESRMAAQELQRALNALLPAAIRVVCAEEVANGFHARHDTVAKSYRYRIFRGRVMPPFLARYAWHYAGPLDEDAMMAAARLFVGEHDFSTFSAAADLDDEDGGGVGGAQPNPVRTLLASHIVRVPALLPGQAAAVVGEIVASVEDYELAYHVRGRSFLRYMVRKIVGTLLEVGRGRLAPADIPTLFEARDRSRSGPTAPPHGLFMESVEYAADSATWRPAEKGQQGRESR